MLEDCLSCYSLSLFQKLSARKATLIKTAAISEKDKETWLQCLVPELMSSEDSEDDGAFLVRPLPWRSDKASNFIAALDHKGKKKRSRRSKVMSFTRKVGDLSDRSRPSGVPSWAVKPQLDQ